MENESYHLAVFIILCCLLTQSQQTDDILEKNITAKPRVKGKRSFSYDFKYLIIFFTNNFNSYITFSL